MTFGELAGLRRVHFEASAIVMAELKLKATEPSGEAGRKLPVAEKTARLRDQEARLTGLRIKGELQTVVCFGGLGGPDERVQLC